MDLVWVIFWNLVLNLRFKFQSCWINFLKIIIFVLDLTGDMEGWWRVLV